MEIIEDRGIKNRKYLEETIGILRFPLMVCVVLQHIFIPNKMEHFSVFCFEKFVIDTIIRVAVPLFFFISGFLFFYGKDKFGIVEYLGNLCKRGKRLLVPYFLWGLFFVGIRYLCYLFGWPDNIDLFVGEFRWLYYVIVFPINYQLWFIRDLFVVVLISPLIYFFLKRLNFLFCFFLGIVWLFYHNNFFVLFGVDDFFISKIVFELVGYDFTSFFFFSFGAWFAIYNKDFTLYFKRLFLFTIVLYVIFIVNKFVYNNDLYLTEVFSRLAIMCGLILVVAFTYVYVKTGKVKRNIFLERGSLLIYYYHVIFLTYFVGVLKIVHIFELENSFVYTLVYIFIPIITILFGLWLYKIGMRYMPRVMNFVLGLK